MDHFPTNWGRPVSVSTEPCEGILTRGQRNEAYAAYNTYPLHHRPYNGPKDAFQEGVQHTQCVNPCTCNLVSELMLCVIFDAGNPSLLELAC